VDPRVHGGCSYTLPKVPQEGTIYEQITGAIETGARPERRGE